MFVSANLAMPKLINVIILGHHMGRGHPRHLPDQPKEVHPRHQNGELISQVPQLTQPKRVGEPD